MGLRSKKAIDERFVVFVKWYEDEDGLVLAHWHLSPASDAILDRVEELLLRRENVNYRVRVVPEEN